MEVLEWTENYNEREIALIREYNTLVPNGYNIAKGGEEPRIIMAKNIPVIKYQRRMLTGLYMNLNLGI